MHYFIESALTMKTDSITKVEIIYKNSKISGSCITPNIVNLMSDVLSQVKETTKWIDHINVLRPNGVNRVFRIWSNN